ncbi:MAG: glycoside hydrolase [Deltaproteobacteria bacterium]|nr:glycoside hydrolase [Deltaproteobacteria bacterium]
MAGAVTLLWHMHQPCYRNAVGGEYRMPWSFLHATKDYYDMLRLALDAGARVTFNLVPSLLDQLDDYSDPGVRDTFLDPLRAHPAELGSEGRRDLLPRLFFAHLDNQIRPLPRFFELHQKRQYHGERAPDSFSPEDFLDLEVLFLIAWTGEIVRREEPEIARLVGEGRGFTQGDKERLLAVLHRTVARTASAYREAQDRGAIEISTTPYYHPILPLLLEVQSAREALPRVTLPVIRRGFGGDARSQVDTAVARYREAFGRPPRGFWPSEGSVSAEALGLLADAGVEWAASDEDILAASLGLELKGRARGELYRPHRFRSEQGRELSVFFRDKGLSDLIGFTYASWDPAEAARDFAGRLGALAREHGPDATISVILDGENAWEFYRSNGAPFLSALYRAVAGHGDLRFATFSERLDGGRLLPRVRAGSWIYGSFSTWVGHPEKNRAWELLERTRCRLADAEAGLADEARRLAWGEIAVAEGSDWFWWLGDDHFSLIAGEFDDLFRLHLMNVYRILGAEVPAELHQPIKGGARRGLVERPLDLLTPRIDGEVTSYFEWFCAGTFDLGYDCGAMTRADRRLRTLRFGRGGGQLFLCVEGHGSLADLTGQGLALEVDALGTRRLRVRFPLDGGAPEVQEGTATAAQVAFSWGRVGELALPLTELGVEGPGEVSFTFRLLRDGDLVERAPLYHMAQLPLPVDYDLDSWSA